MYNFNFVMLEIHMLRDTTLSYEIPIQTLNSEFI